MIRLPPRSTRTDTLFPYTTLFRSAVVCAANLVALAEALFDLNARDPRDRHLVRGLDELGLEAEAAQDGWCNPVPLEIERRDADERSELLHSREIGSASCRERVCQYV